MPCSLDYTILQERLKLTKRNERENDTVIVPNSDGRSFVSKTLRVRRVYKLDTRKIIENAMRNLEELAEEAHVRATSKYQPVEARQRWARIEAYVYQTINSLAKNYDGQLVMEALEDLTRRVEEYMEEDQGPGEEDR